MWVTEHIRRLHQSSVVNTSRATAD